MMMVAERSVDERKDFGFRDNNSVRSCIFCGVSASLRLGEYFDSFVSPVHACLRTPQISPQLNKFARRVTQVELISDERVTWVPGPLREMVRPAYPDTLPNCFPVSRHSRRGSSIFRSPCGNLLIILLPYSGVLEDGNGLAGNFDLIAVLPPERRGRDGRMKLLDVASRRIHRVRWQTYHREAISHELLVIVGCGCSTYVSTVFDNVSLRKTIGRLLLFTLCTNEY
jgi:hypothetical protein